MLNKQQNKVHIRNEISCILVSSIKPFNSGIEFEK
jgi:hypothetical protein